MQGGRIDSPIFNRTSGSGNSFSVRLTGVGNSKHGLAKSLAVKPGDKIDAEVYVKYLDPSTTGTPGSAFAQLITNLANNASSVVIDGATAGTNPMPFAGLMGYGSDNSTGPKAYLNVLVFDQNYQFQPNQSTFKSVTLAARETGTNVPHELVKTIQITIQKPGYVYIYFSNENPTPVEVFFDDFKVTHTNTNIVQKDDYYPFGMSFNSYSAPSGVGQKFKFNEGSEWISENNLNLYWTPNRLYDPVLGRFQGLDKLSDMFTSISPMVFSFNNPLKFKDPTGLSGKGDECENCTELPEIIVTATRLSRSGSNNSITLFSYISSNNPIKRNLGLTAKNKGLNAAHDLMNRGQKLHFSEGEYITAKNSDYMDGIKAMVAYGVTGSMIAVAASPILIENMVQTLGTKVLGDMGIESLWQAGNSLLYSGNLSQIDFADIGFAGMGSKYGFVLMATFDFTSSGEFSMIGFGKNKSQFATDILIGFGNKWHIDAMSSAGVDKGVINVINNFNSPIRNTVGTGIKEGVKDE